MARNGVEENIPRKHCLSLAAKIGFGALFMLIGAGISLAGVSLRDRLSLAAFSSQEEIQTIRVTLPEGITRHEIAGIIADELGWSEEKAYRFRSTLRFIQWDAFNDALYRLLSDEFGWSDEEQRIFFTHATDIIDREDDLLDRAFAAGVYEFTSNTRPSFIAAELVDRSLHALSDPVSFLDERIPEDARVFADAYVKGEMELLPDLIPLPPLDVEIRREGGRVLLAFSTIYYNAGDGVLELVADPETAGIKEDIERTVFQRVYRSDGTFRDHAVGTFLWHQEHLHYHYSDFVDYIFEPVSTTHEDGVSAAQQKSTFCIRDVSRVDISEGTPMEAEYRICGKERQGVSVGWGDTYFHTYADQNIDITNFPSGVYRLAFVVNPSDRIEELSLKNNESAATLKIDVERGTVEVLSFEPQEFPEVEHVHVEQDL